MLDTDRLVCLQHGRVARFDACLLVQRCQELGITLTDDGGVLDARGPITPEIDAGLRRLKHHVLLLLTNVPSDLHCSDTSAPFPEHGPIVKARNARG